MTDGRPEGHAIAGGASLAAVRAWVRFVASDRGARLKAIRVAALGLLVVVALATPGFTSKPSILSMLTTVSFIGCVAVGMTFVTISGNIISFCLGATASVTAITFMAGLAWGVPAALVIAFATGGIINLAQGLLVGYVRANPIIVSIAALTLVTGVTNLVTTGRRVYPAGGGFEFLTNKVAGIPIEFLVFLAVVAVAQLILSRTQFGRNVYMVGSNHRAAEAAGVRNWRTVGGTYLLAGLFASVAGILMGARYELGDMELGFGYDYDAIAAVLVGGTAIHGGVGSVSRTLLGAAIIAIVQVLLVLHGFSRELQYLMTGLIILGVIMLHTVGGQD